MSGQAQASVGQRKPVRVLINGLHAKAGGGLTYIRAILPHLADDPDLSLHLFIHQSQLSSLDRVDDRIRVHVFSFKPTIGFLMIWEQVALPILARIMGADVTFSPANYGPIAAPRPVIMLRNALAVVGRETRLRKRLYWLSLSAMTGISLLFSRRAIAVSRYAKRALSFGFDRVFGQRVTIIYHGVGESFSASPHPEPEQAFLLCVGDVYIQKNYHAMLAVFAQLKRQHSGLHLRIAGGTLDTSYLDELLHLSRALGIQDSVEFLGTVDHLQLTELYRTCRVFVFPSTVETFGNPLVEAMACGAAIAASNTAVMPEILGDAAAYFDPLDTASMTATLERLLDDPSWRAELRVRGQKRARDFSWAKTALATASVIKDAAGPRVAD